jgi:hypothetical protein
VTASGTCVIVVHSSYWHLHNSEQVVEQMRRIHAL